ncbi:exonuclease [Purpureocillium lavendulum]|uniref:Exonuclease n=1 Tax=Purpureocillium lavendulum TaxID=1247861 RepID=A0AB34G2A8_9HYPO|nr:exonuclease [Purpureocillium lavendulum]
MHGYYGGAPVSPTQTQSTLSGPQTMPYYSNQMMMNPPQPTYYYPQGGQYANPTQNAIILMTAEACLCTLSNKTRRPVGRVLFGVHRESHGKATDLMSLVQHVCKETPGLESLFLISKSNCAFANFKDDKTCVAAQQKLHESTFQTVRLVSRLRKNTVEGATGLTAPTGPSANNTPSASAQTPVENPQSDTPPDSGNPNSAAQQHDVARQPMTDGTSQQDRFFILKSLTMEDLELSVSTGIWATQSHNEEALNSAFKSADNVYLIFSANKSGEYFGYARMTSEINEDPAAAVEFAPKAQAADELDLPKAIPTEATEYAPKGKIIDDSARGTIFWETERDESDNVSDDASEVSSDKSALVDGEAKTWGKPFKLEWLSTHRLPFYRTRGLRNPWNSNREVKIARDGTELEPSIGRRLIGLFNRVQSPVPLAPPMGMPMPMMPGYPTMRPYGS